MDKRKSKILLLLTFLFIGAVVANAGTTGDLFQDAWNKFKTFADDAYLGYIFAGLGAITGGQAYLGGDKKLATERVILFSSLGLVTGLSEKTAGALAGEPNTTFAILEIAQSSLFFLAGA